MHKVYTSTQGLQGRVHHGRKRRADVLGCGGKPLGILCTKDRPLKLRAAWQRGGGNRDAK